MASCALLRRVEPADPEFIKAGGDSGRSPTAHTFYTSNAGMPSLVAPSRRSMKTAGVSLRSRYQIVVGASGVQALNVGIRCVLDPGDEALVLTPPPGLTARPLSRCQRSPCCDPTSVVREIAISIDFDAWSEPLHRHEAARLYLAANPLGWVATVDEQRRLLEFCRRHDSGCRRRGLRRLYLCGGSLGDPVPYHLRLAAPRGRGPGGALVLEDYCMTGWRVDG